MGRLVLAFFVLAGCDSGHSHDHGRPSGHDPEEPAVRQVTVWTDRFEIFLEHEPVVAGAPADFVTHVTDLRTLEPRREGPVAFVLKRGDEAPIEHLEAAPRRPGIYVPSLKFPAAGDWAVALRIDAESRVDLPGIRVFASADEAAKATAEAPPDGITFLKEQQWRLRTKAEPVAARALVQRLRLPAIVSARPGSRASGVPPLAGRVLPPAGRPFPSIGAKVEADQVLALVQPAVSDLAARLVEAEAELARAGIALAQAERSHERIRKLASSGARSERDVEEAESALRTAQSANEAARALRRAYETSGLTIRPEHGNLPVFELRSPIAGTVIHVGAAVGEHVPQDRSVFTVLSTDIVLVEARMPESAVPRLGTSRRAVYGVPGAPDRFLPLPDEGVYLGLEVDPASRTVPLVYTVPNPDGGLRVGMALTVHVETGRAEEALAVPESAIVDVEGRPTAYVQLAGETFEKRDLVLGLRDSGHVQVVEGLSAGERVVVQGAYAVRLASLSTALPAHGHAH